MGQKATRKCSPNGLKKRALHSETASTFVSDEPTVKRDVPPNFGSLFWKYRARPGLRRSSFRVRRLLGQPRGPLAHEQPCDRWDNAGRTRPSQNRRRPRHRRPDLRQSKKSDAVTKGVRGIRHNPQGVPGCDMSYLDEIKIAIGTFQKLGILPKEDF
jgi:hypothetical protein